MSAESQRICPSCGNEFPEAIEFCPVCMLRKGLAGGVESGDSSFEEAVKPTPDQTAKRFEHYELVTGEDGKPVELLDFYLVYRKNLSSPLLKSFISICLELGKDSRLGVHG